MKTFFSYTLDLKIVNFLICASSLNSRMFNELKRSEELNNVTDVIHNFI